MFHASTLCGWYVMLGFIPEDEGCHPQHISIEAFKGGLRFARCNATGMCAAWMEETSELEVYMWTRPAENHGVLELVHILRDVRELPHWRDILIQVCPHIVRELSGPRMCRRF